MVMTVGELPLAFLMMLQRVDFLMEICIWSVEGEINYKFHEKKLYIYIENIIVNIIIGKS